MNRYRLQQDQGAPLRAFVLVLALWIAGRLLWENFLPNEMGGHIPIAAGKAAKPQKTTKRPYESQSDDSVSAKQNGSRIFAGKIYRRTYPSLTESDGLNIHFVAGSYSARINQHHRPPPSSFDQVEKFDLGKYGLQEDPVVYRQTNRFSRDRLAIETSGGQNVRKRKKLSGYMWVFARQGTPRSVSDATPVLPSFGGERYGGSQFGAILALKISRREQQGISLYSRVSSPLRVQGEEQLAVGSSYKPLKKLPITFFVEQRFGRAGGLDRGRAIYVAGGTGPDELVRGVSLESYGQTGILQSRGTNYFFDGSVTVQKSLLNKGNKKLAVGGGLWTGGQEDVSRLDIGPRISTELQVADLPVRVSVDLRHRVAGNARPKPGLAISASTGF